MGQLRSGGASEAADNALRQSITGCAPGHRTGAGPRGDVRRSPTEDTLLDGRRGILRRGLIRHLLHNLALTLEEFLLQKRPLLSRAASPGTEPEDKDDG